MRLPVLVPLVLSLATTVALAQNPAPSLTLSASSDANGALDVELTGFTPSSTHGLLVIDLNPNLPLGGGPTFGLHMNGLEFLQYIAGAGPAAVGNLARWVRPSPGLFPDAPISIPGGFLPNGLTIDMVALAKDLNDTTYQVSNTARVTIGSAGVTVTGVSATTAAGGDMITITGTGFGGQGDQFCVALVTATGQMHGFEPVHTTDTTMVIRAPEFPVGPAGVVGQLMIQKGEAARGWFTPILVGFPGVLPAQQLWGWNPLPIHPGLVAAPTFTGTRAASANLVLHGTLSGNSQSYNVVLPAGACTTGATICIAARMFDTTGRGADCRHGVKAFTVPAGLSHSQCCEMIRQAIQACFQSRGIFDMQVDCLLQGNGDVLISMHFVPATTISMGELNITIKP